MERDFTQIIDDIRKIDGIDYSLIQPFTDEIIATHEEMEKRIYDLEGDLKSRDDYIEKAKKEYWDKQRTETSDTDDGDDDADDDDEKVVETAEMIDTPIKKEEE